MEFLHLACKVAGDFRIVCSGGQRANLFLAGVYVGCCRFIHVRVKVVHRHDATAASVLTKTSAHVRSMTLARGSSAAEDRSGKRESIVCLIN